MGWRVMGTNRTERVLPVGMVVTAIGEVSKVKDIGGHIGLNGGLLRHQGDILVMRAPQHGPFIISKRSLGSIVTSLNEVSRICRCGRVCGGGVCGGVCGALTGCQDIASTTRAYRYIAFGFTTVGVALVAIKAARGCMAHIRQKQLRYVGGARWGCLGIPTTHTLLHLQSPPPSGHGYWQLPVSVVPWWLMQMVMSTISRDRKWMICVLCV